MKYYKHFILGGLTSVLLSGCVTPPPTRIVEPTVVKPLPVPTNVVNNGAIYQTSYNRAYLFEDQRARNIGDTMVIQIQENVSATKSSQSKANRSSSGSASGGGIINPNSGGAFGGSFSSGNKFSGDGGSGSNYSFTGTIGATVVDVLPNGNLVVSGEKQIGINQGEEYIRISGIVNPMFVSGNTVKSSQIADVKIEYRGTGYVNESQVMPWLARFFLNILPF